jgi:hypothetical protein
VASPRPTPLLAAVAAAAGLTFGCCTAAQAVTLISPPAGAVVQSDRPASFTVGLDFGEFAAQVVLVRQRGGVVGLDDPLWENDWDAESPFAADGNIAWTPHLKIGFYSYRGCAKSAESEEEEDLDCLYGDQIRTIEVDDGDEKPCRGTYGGGFYREISATKTTCDKARGVTRSWVKKSGFGQPRPKFPKRLTVGVHKCTLQHFGGRHEGAYDRVTCKASKGRQVRFYGSP